MRIGGGDLSRADVVTVVEKGGDRGLRGDVPEFHSSVV